MNQVDELKALFDVSDLQSMSAQKILDKFVLSETMYVERVLRTIVEGFSNRIEQARLLKSEVISVTHSNIIFHNINSIYEFNRKMCAELIETRWSGLEVLLTNIGKKIQLYIPFLKMYTTYITNSKIAQTVLKEQREGSVKFKDFLSLNEICCGKTLEELLRIPIDRFPQYLIYLGMIKAKLGFENNELDRAIRDLQKVADGISSTIKEENARSGVVDVQTKFFGNLCEIIQPGRMFIKKDELKLMTPDMKTKTTCHVFLFNDLLLIGQRGLIGAEVLHILRLEGLVLDDVPGSRDTPFGFKLTSDIDNERNLILLCPTVDEKYRWLKRLLAAIDKAAVMSVKVEVIESAADFKNRIMKRRARSTTVSIKRPPNKLRTTLTQLEPIVDEELRSPKKGEQEDVFVREESETTDTPKGPSTLNSRGIISYELHPSSSTETLQEPYLPLHAIPPTSKTDVGLGWCRVLMYQHTSGEIAWLPPSGIVADSPLTPLRPASVAINTPMGSPLPPFPPPPIPMGGPPTPPIKSLSLRATAILSPGLTSAESRPVSGVRTESNDLLSQIQKGKQLRKAVVEDKKHEPNALSGISVALAKSLNQYRKFVQAEDKSDDDDEDDWD